MRRELVFLVPVLLCTMTLIGIAGAAEEDVPQSSWQKAGQEIGEAARAVGEASSETVQKVREKGSEVWEKAQEKGSEIKEESARKSGEVIEQTHETGKRIWEKTKETSTELADKARQKVHEMTAPPPDETNEGASGEGSAQPPSEEPSDVQ